MELENFILKSFKDLIIENKLVKKDSIELLIDGTIGSYIINTIRQFYAEYEYHRTWLDDNAEQEFDIENFSDIIEEFLPGFYQIEKNVITKWLVNLKQRIDDMASETNVNQKKIIGPCEEVVSAINSNETTREAEFDPEIQILVEMFPDVNIKEISKVFKKSHKDKTEAIEYLIMTKNKINPKEVNDDLTEEEKNNLKQKTLQKFGLVQVNEDGSPIEAKPKFIWNEEKKLHRYYENKIVSTKGEKIFEYKTEKDQELEKQMKKTYINLKPARKYRFH
ncbi:CUE domain-containing 2 [Brachionus plicatilis]|uniref:CUE domain-containing 2 n=1 Tax=Brachionus plicatilis TaxID=10195 RepID=A0A3M7RZB6_BRAPC|nr:CUE domain-containing 2 [Brachionus plicatilis]